MSRTSNRMIHDMNQERELDILWISMLLLVCALAVLLAFVN